MGEIETTLALHQPVPCAVVVIRGEAQDEKRLVAFVVPREAANPASAKVQRDFLKEKLPDCMVLAEFAERSDWSLALWQWV